MNLKDPFKDSFLSLIRLGIGHPVTILPTSIDWDAIQNLASKQGLSAIILDGAQKLADCGELSDGRKMDVALKKKWIGRVIQNYERKYDDYRNSIESLARYYNEHGFQMMLLKGYGLSLNYPIPRHRPCGDIDIWLFGKYKAADLALSKDMSIRIDKSHHHHTVFQFKGYTVENHYDFVNVHGHTSSARLEKIFKELGQDYSNTVDIGGQVVYLPSPDLHALFIIRHCLSHFASTQLNLRQVLDWGFFVEKYTQDIHWDWLQKTLEEFHMMDFFICMNAICVETLGFDSAIFPPIAIDFNLTNRVLNDTLSPEFNEPCPSGFFPRVFFKYRRWRANKWKHQFCFEESLFKSLITGIWAHLLKPSSI